LNKKNKKIEVIMNTNRIFKKIIMVAICCAFNVGSMLGMAGSISTTSASTDQKNIVPSLCNLCAQAVYQHVDWRKYFAADGDSIEDLPNKIILKNSNVFIPVPFDLAEKIQRNYLITQDYDDNLTHVLYGHTGPVRCMLVYNNELVSGSDDKTIRRWDLKTNQCIREFREHMGCVNCMLLYGDELLSGSSSGNIIRWNLETNAWESIASENMSPVECMLLYHDELILGLADGSIKKWNLTTNQYTPVYTKHKGGIRCIALYKDNLLISADNKKIIIWNLTTDEVIHTFKVPTRIMCGEKLINKHIDYSINCMLVQNDQLLLGSDDGIKQWDINLKQYARNFSKPGCVNCILIHGDELISSLVNAGMMAPIHRYHLQQDKVLKSLKGHENWVNCIIGYGDNLISGSLDNTIKIWTRGSFTYHMFKKALSMYKNKNLISRNKLLASKLYQDLSPKEKQCIENDKQ
jgi:WD40 repeat protein